MAGFSFPAPSIPQGATSRGVPLYRPCWAEVRLDALRQNFRVLRQHLSMKSQILAVVKADAYGHGLVPVSRVAVEEGAVFLGVSSLEEGMALREAGFQVPVLVLGSLYPFDSFPVLFEKHLTPTIASLEAADALHQIAVQRNESLGVHLKVDSGFGRIGISTANALEFIAQVQSRSSLRIEGLYTHFASSDIDPEYTREQARCFHEVVQAAQARGIQPRWIHMANSSAVLRFPETHGSLARPGLAFYGIAPYPGAEGTVSLQPALAWKTRIIFLKWVRAGASVSYARTWTARRPTRVATLAVGYADGFPRLLSNQGHVLIAGQRAPVIGRVTMDMTMVDVTHLPDCHVGDEAVLIGSQDGESLQAEEMARRAQTNPYEILCRIAARVPRVYR